MIAEWIFIVTLGGASVADGVTTHMAFNRCPSCYESNPVPRGNRLWPALAAGTFTTAWAGHELKKHNKKYWWAPVLGATATHFMLARRNTTKFGLR